MKKWRLISSKNVFDHKWFKLRQDTVELPNGKIIDDYFIWPAGDVVIIVPITPDNKFILVKQYKHGIADIVIEFPAGMMEENENHPEAALRELEEETGYSSDQLTLLGNLVNNPTKATGETYVYLAKNAKLAKMTNFDEAEEIELLEKSPTELVEMILNGEIQVSGSISAAFLALKKMNFL